MKIDTAGTYTLRYSAEDDCGNVGTHDRTLTVVAPRTVLYTDGTFIINEQPGDRATNEALHGVATNEYAPFDPNGATDIEKYIFVSSSARPWYAQRASILTAEIGDNISPTNTAYWFDDLPNVTQINVDKLDTKYVEDMRDMFHNCRNLISVDVSGFDTQNVTNMSCMFWTCPVLASIDVSDFDTSNVTDMSYMFSGCGAITTIDVSNFNTSNVTNMNAMFADLTMMQSLDLSNFDTSKVTNMDSMFLNGGMTSIILGVFNATKVTTMNRMFEGCRSLNSISFTSFTASDVTNMSYMFKNCRKITEIDVSGFATNNATETREMFNYCKMLTKIYVSVNFVVSSVTVSSSMFGNLDVGVLKGGAGTGWSSGNPTDKTYARIDNPPDAPGYFTLKPTT